MGESFFWTEAGDTKSSSPVIGHSASTTALDFVLFGATLESQHITRFRLRDELSVKERREAGRDTHQIVHIENVGQGGGSVVSLGTLQERDVAVKASRFDSKSFGGDMESFLQYLASLMTELKILICEEVEKHTNFVRLLSWGMGSLYQPDAFLVLEYSDLGGLDRFLINQSDLTDADQYGFCVDVAHALNTLHELGVSHGDVKTSNVLVFSGIDFGRRWIAKVTDFGQAIMAPDATSAVRPSPGTFLYNAPEVRSGAASHDQSFNVTSALRTDIFSYGLLIWEILNRGNVFIDLVGSVEGSAWDRKAVLNRLSPSELQSAALRFLDKVPNFRSSLKARIRTVLEGALHDDPCRRRSMPDILRAFEKEPNEDIVKKSTTFAWQRFTNFKTFPEDESFINHLNQFVYSSAAVVTDIPQQMQRQVISELKALVLGADPHDAARAALVLSECATFGFGMSISLGDTVEWIVTSARKGNPRATMWHLRLYQTLEANLPHGCIASTNSVSMALETAFVNIPNRLYWPKRLRAYNKVACAQFLGLPRAWLIEESITLEEAGHFLICLEPFAPDSPSKMGGLELAALAGDIQAATDILAAGYDVNSCSESGRTAIYYACLAGHLKMLRTLVHNGADVSTQDIKGISPVHFLIMFESDEAVEALDLLVTNGADLDASISESVHWKAHDLLLKPTALEWAVQARNVDIVRLLLLKGANTCGPNLAIRCHFPEIIDVLLSWHRTELHTDQLVWSLGIEKPIAHYLAHGKEHSECFLWTLEVLRMHGHFVENPELLDKIDLKLNRNFFTYLVDTAQTPLDIALIETLIALGVDVKKRYGEDDQAHDVFFLAIPLSEYANSAWEGVLQAVLSQYSAEELNNARGLPCPYLHHAITLGSLSAIRLLLERGADPNLRSEESVPMTPLELCFSSKEAVVGTKIHRLLVTYGADTMAPTWLPNHFDTFVASLPGSTWSLDGVLEHISPENLSDQLHGWLPFWGFSYLRTGSSLDSLMAVRLLCQHDRVRQVLDTPKDDSTLLQKAVLELNYEVAQILLESGAEFDMASQDDLAYASPLSTVLARGSTEWLMLVCNPKEISADQVKNRSNAWKLASLLLKYHQSAGSKMFRGITDVHLAAYMNDLDSLQNLLDNGADIHARGDWPVGNRSVTARELFVGSRSWIHGTFFTIEAQGQDIYDNVRMPDLPRNIEHNYDLALSLIKEKSYILSCAVEIVIRTLLASESEFRTDVETNFSQEVPEEAFSSLPMDEIQKFLLDRCLGRPTSFEPKSDSPLLDSIVNSPVIERLRERCEDYGQRIIAHWHKILRILYGVT